MKQFLNKALLGLAGMGLAATSLVSCADNDLNLYEVGAPDWVQNKIDSIAGSVVVKTATDDRTPFVTLTCDTKGVFSVFNVHVTGQMKKFKVTTDDGKFENEEFDGGGAWWDDVSPTTGDYALADGSTLTFIAEYVDADSKFIIETSDGTNYYTVTNDLNQWNAPDEIKPKCELSSTYDYDKKGAFNEYKVGEQVAIYVSREGNVITVKMCSDEYHGDPQPKSINLTKAPTVVEKAADGEEVNFFGDMTAEVEFVNGTKKVVDLKDFIVQAPDFSTPGDKTVILIYNKTYDGESATSPCATSYTFQYGAKVIGFTATSKKADNIFYYNDRNRTLSPEFFETVAKLEGGSTSELNADNCTFELDATTGKIVAKWNDFTADVTATTAKVTTSEISGDQLKNQAFGMADFTNGWWPETKPEVITNYFYDLKGDLVKKGSSVKYNMHVKSAAAVNWQGPCTVLKNESDIYNGQIEYAVVRPDAFGWGTFFDNVDANKIVTNVVFDNTWQNYLKDCDMVITITNLGGTATVKYEITSGENKCSIEYAINKGTIPADDFYVTFALEGSMATMK